MLKDNLAVGQKHLFFLQDALQMYMYTAACTYFLSKGQQEPTLYGILSREKSFVSQELRHDWCNVLSNSKTPSVTLTLTLGLYLRGSYYK